VILQPRDQLTDHAADQRLVGHNIAVAERFAVHVILAADIEPMGVRFIAAPGFYTKGSADHTIVAVPANQESRTTERHAALGCGSLAVLDQPLLRPTKSIMVDDRFVPIRSANPLLWAMAPGLFRLRHGLHLAIEDAEKLAYTSPVPGYFSEVHR